MKHAFRKLTSGALLCLALMPPRPAAAVGPIFFCYRIPSFPTWGKATQPIPFIELDTHSPSWLVRVKVVKVDETPFSSTRLPNESFEPDEVVIEESFTGPDLSGQHCQITDPHKDGKFLVTSPEVGTARYHVGQEFLISVVDDAPLTGASPRQLRASYSRVAAPYGLDPVVEVNPNRWRAKHLKYATAIRKAYTAPPKQLEALLRQYARGDDTPLAVWAPHTLALWIDNTNPAATTPAYPLPDRQASLKWLGDLTKDKRRPVAQQLALEDMLHRLDASHWTPRPCG